VELRIDLVREDFVDIGFVCFGKVSGSLCSDG